MMKSIRPRISTSARCQAVAGLLPSQAAPIRAAALGDSTRHFGASLQQPGNTAAYSTRPSSRTGPFINNAALQKSSPRVSLSGRHAPSRAVPVHASYTTQAASPGEPTIHDVFETKTGTWQYVVADPSTSAAVIIDPVLDYDPVTQAITTQTADSLLALVKEQGYKVDAILETHAHADHLTAASYLQSRLTEEQGHRPSIGIGKRIGQVQKLFGQKYGVPRVEYERVVDKLFDDDETFNIGDLKATAIHLPGHTPDHLGYKIGDNVFCGDSIFHADIGTARCDFPGGSANNLFNSARKLLSMPDHVKIWTGHDYPPEDRSSPSSWMSVGEHKKQNRHIKDGITEDEFVALRTERDATLAAPRLLDQSLQINIRGGRLPKPSEAGLRMLHLPLKTKGVEW